MKITIKRKYKKQGYTIGELYLNDIKMLCNTLEPEDKGLVSKLAYRDTTSDEYIRFRREVKVMKLTNKKGTVAIPAGTYPVSMEISKKFNAKRPYLRYVPGFDGVMIHEGNTRKDTEGCILVGENTVKGCVLNSKHYLGIICDRLNEAQEKREQIRIVICEE